MAFHANARGKPVFARPFLFNKQARGNERKDENPTEPESVSVLVNELFVRDMPSSYLVHDLVPRMQTMYEQPPQAFNLSEPLHLQFHLYGVLPNSPVSPR